MGKPVINFLSEAEVKKVHEATLEVLEHTGVKTNSKEALDILKEAGANVDYESKHVTIPAKAVEQALRRAPKTVKLCGRDPEHDVILDKTKTHFSTSGFAPHIMDWETGKRRDSTSEDLARWARLVDYLDNIHLTWTSLVANDAPPPMQAFVELATCFRNTAKHIVPNALDARTARYQIEIAAAVAGGRKELKKRPLISPLVCPAAPLTYEKGATEAAIEFARAGLPVVCLPMPLAGATGPVTPLGVSVVNNAEFLGNLVIQEFASPGAPVIYGSTTTVANPRTAMAVLGAPERSVIQMILAQLASYYKLPCMLAGDNSDAKTPDFQCGFEKTMTLTTIVLMGNVDIVVGSGCLDTGSAMSPEALVIDNEITKGVMRIRRGFEVDEGNLALDVIHKVGPGGIYLGEKHTLKRYKEEIWMPKLIYSGSYDDWLKAGSRTMYEVAKEKVKEILATHKVEPLPEDVEAKISQILNSAEAEFLKKS